ncbi:hypothetical protein PInf_003662 [Phytophthora infestans]|nr:hypothetical protein PInf_003662 [Phytophthora infestans]
MADDEVATLERELETLKLQLEKERKKNTAEQDDSRSDTKQERKPEQGATPEGTKSQRRGGDKKAAPSSKEPRIYVQHAAVGSRRGKWWLRERQVLSRTIADEDGAVTLKVRETWVWSGRTVILDKIVRLDEETQEDKRAVGVEKDKPEIAKEEPDNKNKVPFEATPSSVQPSKEAETSAEAVVDSKAVVTATKANDEESIIETIMFGLTLQWNVKSVRDFVNAANSNTISDEKRPVWISQSRGQITEQVFKSDVMACLAVVAGGPAQENDLAPNTIWQHMNIVKRLGQIENDPFVQSCMSQLDLDTYLAVVFLRHEPGFDIQPMRSDPPIPPNRQVFY